MVQLFIAQFFSFPCLQTLSSLGLEGVLKLPAGRVGMVVWRLSLGSGGDQLTVYSQCTACQSQITMSTSTSIHDSIVFGLVVKIVGFCPKKHSMYNEVQYLLL